MKRLTLFLAILVVGFTTKLQAAEECIPEAPRPARLVNDFANVIDDNVELKLERALVTFNDTTSTQIAIVTVEDLCDYDRASFAYEIGERWGVGNAKFNNGIVVLVKPKQVNSKGQAFIATGYGLEGVLPDATAKRIVEKEMIPFFKKNDYTSGILASTQIIMDITGGEYSAKNYNSKGRKKGKKPPVFPLLFILVFILIMVSSTIRRARRYGRSNNMGLWTALWLMGSMNSRHRGRYNDFTSGGGGFGGGGFGGFGGGSFGGGGAGGSW